jgi:hypothetical protein
MPPSAAKKYPWLILPRGILCSKTLIFILSYLASFSRASLKVLNNFYKYNIQTFFCQAKSALRAEA